MTAERQATPAGPRGRRWALVAAAGAGISLVVASVAWACTLHIGTLLVCQPPSATYTNGTQCSKVTGSGSQVGLASIRKAGGSSLSVKATNFRTKTYSANLRAPGSTANCHRPGTGVIRLGTGAGPNFTVTASSPALTTTGKAAICVQDEPNVVDGNQVNVAVI